MKRLPKTPNGNVDKRTKEYKEYTAQQEAQLMAKGILPPRFIEKAKADMKIEMKVKAPSVLDEAQSLIHGDREQDYGPPSKNLRAIADMWEMYLHHKYGAEFPIEAADVAWMMTLLKMCRDFNGAKRDTIVDAAGYIGLIGRVRYE